MKIELTNRDTEDAFELQIRHEDHVIGIVRLCEPLKPNESVVLQIALAALPLVN